MHTYIHGQANDTFKRVRHNCRDHHKATNLKGAQKPPPAEPWAQDPMALREVGNRNQQHRLTTTVSRSPANAGPKSHKPKVANALTGTLVNGEPKRIMHAAKLR